MAKGSNKQFVVISWITWHFIEMPDFLVQVWKNYLSFGVYYFSIPLLLKTLFSPWRQYRWRYPRGFDIGGYLSTFISNMFSRVAGAIARLMVIIIGIAVQIIIVLAGILGIVLWVAMPFIFMFLIWFFVTLPV